MSIRIQNTRAIGAAMLYCHTSVRMKRCPGRIRNSPRRCARNDATAGRPTTPMNRR